MAWNEPGKDDGKPQDPWSGRDKKPAEGPPDLDEVIKKLQARFKNVFGKSGKGGDAGNGSNEASNSGGFMGLGFILATVAVIWFLTGFFIVQPAERGVVLRFGKYTETLEPGLHWIPRLIDSITKVNVQQIYSYSYPVNKDAEMLTRDENLVDVAVTVFYRIDNPNEFLYNVANPVESMQQATASALRQVVGSNDLDTILTTGREQVRDDVQKQLQLTLSRYQSGFEITGVAIKSAKAPDQVQEAFDDATKAREDRERYINQAEAYAMNVKPMAEGKAKRYEAAAKAYQQQIVLKAEADTASFLAILPEYEKAREVTRERMYLDSIESVFSNSSKVLVDTANSNNLLYLPLDKILKENDKKLGQLPSPVNEENNDLSAMTSTKTTPMMQTARPSAISSGNVDDAYGIEGGY